MRIKGRDNKIFPPNASNEANNKEKIAMVDLTILDSFFVLILAKNFKTI